ncbi:ubiquitin carboxyl-terminal hydrolase 1 [Trichomycterus rosablanca]|uniref:ubiquitin carboxyl-terminal hydrolase 1 n=1 Tax=Trichomycterus rosablanca TaxID=2290929 RepID=UPI002F35AEB9
MPGLHSEFSTVVESPVRKNRLSLRFLQKKETKRALDFTEPQPEEPEPNIAEPADITSRDQVVPTPCPSSLPCERRESLVPFVGLNNLGNTCYLNSILQVLYYCPGFKDAIKSLYHLSKLKDKPKDDVKSEEQGDPCRDSVPVPMELLHSFYSLISSVEQLQSSFLFNRENHNDAELATPPRRILNTLRQLNPMYEGYLQHDAQEVLQCILAYIQEACDTIKKDLTSDQETPNDKPEAEEQLGGKRKSDTEVGNAKKKPKSQSKPKQSEEDSRPFTRSKRKSSSDVSGNSHINQKEKDGAEVGEGKEKQEGSNTEEEKSRPALKGTNKSKLRAKLNWLKSSSKQPSILFKFRSMGRIRSHAGDKADDRDKAEQMISESQEPPDRGKPVPDSETSAQEQNQPAATKEEVQGLDALKRLFQGQLVLRTRCLECECYTERREDFQDISVPVQEDETSCIDATSEISPNPKPERKTLKWAVSQFASVERIVGEDKYFCETCRHYTEAERSLLFDKTPDVVTIHLKCFSASGSEMDPYAGLSKVNTPLHTPLKLSLKEWSTKPSSPQQEDHYQLFAVVMHSGVTISSGHYTAYIRMTDLRRTEIEPHPEGDGRKEEPGETRPPTEPPPPDYDDGEVSFSLGSKAKDVTGGTGTSGKAGGKRASEGVGLLGGQRSVSSFEIGTSKRGAPERSARSPVPARKGASGKEREEGRGGREEGRGGREEGRGGREEGRGGREEGRVSLDSALQNLMEYEGRWMLFDDSEVRLFQEEEFLRACSPDTCSTSTPYLLFYKKVTGEMN